MPAPRELRARVASRHAGVFHSRGGSRRDGAAGFSLVELVMVMLIIGVAGAIALPRFASAQDRYRIEGAAGRLAADLEMARSRALTSGRAQTVEFKPDAGVYTLTSEAALDQPGTPQYVVDLTGDPYRAAITKWDVGGDNVLVFDTYGMPDSAVEIVVAIGGQSRTIRVNRGTGRADIHR